MLNFNFSFYILAYILFGEAIASVQSLEWTPQLEACTTLLKPYAGREWEEFAVQTEDAERIHKLVTDPNIVAVGSIVAKVNGLMAHIRNFSNKEKIDYCQTHCGAFEAVEEMCGKAFLLLYLFVCLTLAYAQIYIWIDIHISRNYRFIKTRYIRNIHIYI